MKNLLVRETGTRKYCAYYMCVCINELIWDISVSVRQRKETETTQSETKFENYTTMVDRELKAAPQQPPIVPIVTPAPPVQKPWVPFAQNKNNS